MNAMAPKYTCLYACCLALLHFAIAHNPHDIALGLYATDSLLLAAVALRE